VLRHLGIYIRFQTLTGDGFSSASCRLVQGNFGALKRLNLHTSVVSRIDCDLDVPADIGWAIPPLETITLAYAQTWFAAKVMNIVHTRKLVLDPVLPPILNSFDFIRFLPEMPSLDIETRGGCGYQRGREVESLYKARGIRFIIRTHKSLHQWSLLPAAIIIERMIVEGMLCT
jgi:hypothetical protein